MKTYWGTGGIVPRILDIGNRWKRALIRETHSKFCRKTWREETIRRPRRRWDNMRIDIWEIGWKGVDWIHLAQDRNQWVCSCEHGNENPGFTKGKEFDQASDY